jgi:hypothetical protein
VFLRVISVINLANWVFDEKEVIREITVSKTTKLIDSLLLQVLTVELDNIFESLTVELLLWEQLIKVYLKTKVEFVKI